MFRRALVSLAGVAALFALSLPASAQPRHFHGKIDRYVPSGVYLQTTGGTNYIPWNNAAFFINGQQVALTPQQFPPGTDIEAYSEQGTGPSDNQAPPPQAYFGPPPGQDQEESPLAGEQDGVVDVYAEPRAGEEDNPYAVPNYNTGLYLGLGLGFGYPYWGGGYWGGGWGGYRRYYNGYRGWGGYNGYNGYRGGGYNGYRGSYNSGAYNAYRGNNGGFRGSYNSGGYRSSGSFRGSSGGARSSGGGFHGGGGHGGGHR